MNNTTFRISKLISLWTKQTFENVLDWMKPSASSPIQFKTLSLASSGLSKVGEKKCNSTGPPNSKNPLV
jgi:hypothetical protein